MAYLHHEPLLQHFRSLKTFLRRLHRAKVAHDSVRLASLSANRPAFSLNHLVKERYPAFHLALYDLDDGLNLLALFHHLPTTTLVRAFTPEYAAAISTLLHEFLLYTAHTSSLTKVFVSIKGVYYQAAVKGQAVTWLMPHQFTQHLPGDVDYRVMFTFVQWYVTVLRFVNFKLYHDEGLSYPPAVKGEDWERGKGLGALVAQKKKEGEEEPVAAAASTGGKAGETEGKGQRSPAEGGELHRTRSARAAAGRRGEAAAGRGDRGGGGEARPRRRRTAAL